MTEKLTRPQMVALARQMWDNGEGWTVGEIRRYLTDRGHHLHWTTIRAWVDEDYATRRNERRRARNRAYNRDRRSSTRFLIIDDDARDRLGYDPAEALPDPPTTTGPDVLLALRVEDKLAYTAIAAVSRRFLGEDMTEAQVRRRLHKLGVPKNPNKTRANLVRAERQAA